MISISTLYCGSPLPSHSLRYRPDPAAGPVVVFNCTDRCNLACAHCYCAATATARPDELSTSDAVALLDELAAAGAPVVLFSGGEPTLRDDLPELIARAAGAGMRAVLSTNGTRLTDDVAERLAAAGVSYVGVSIDGLAGRHDRFRGRTGAFDEALAGLDACRRAGLKTGLRMTLTRRNAADLDGVLELLVAREIPRVCFYHLVPAGRGRQMQGDDLDRGASRAVLDRLMDFAAAHRDVEVLTVDNHADGPYVHLRLLREDPAAAAAALALLEAGGGNASGVRLACVRANGDVQPDQFWHTATLGNVRRRPFREIWTDPDNELLARLRRRPRPVGGRCAGCRWLSVCNGNLRARAEALTGDRWAADPACCLSDEEIAPER